MISWCKIVCDTASGSRTNLPPFKKVLIAQNETRSPVLWSTKNSPSPCVGFPRSSQVVRVLDFIGVVLDFRMEQRNVLRDVRLTDEHVSVTEIVSC